MKNGFLSFDPPTKKKTPLPPWEAQKERSFYRATAMSPAEIDRHGYRIAWKPRRFHAKYSYPSRKKSTDVRGRQRDLSSGFWVMQTFVVAGFRRPGVVFP